MLYFLWTAINGVVLIYFFASCVTAARAVRERAGLLPLLVVVFGLVSLHGSSSESAPQSSHSAGHVWDEVVEHKYSTLEDYHLAKLELGVTYALTADSSRILQSNTSLSGLKLGVNWQPIASSITIKADQLSYQVVGVMHWKLLGTTIYRERKQLTGVVQL